MIPELRQFLLDKLLEEYLEGDLKNDEDWSVWSKDENLRDVFAFSDWPAPLKCHPFPTEPERAEIAKQAFGIFAHRHPDAPQILKRIQAKDAAMIAQLDEEKPAPTWKKKNAAKQSGKVKSKYKRAKQAARSPETWRILRNYPDYEISSHARVRSLQRNADDCLKPRYSWHYGKLAVFYDLRDSQGKKFSRWIGPLMVTAGFVTEPKWMSKKTDEELVSAG